MEWINVKTKLPESNTRVLRYNSIMNKSQENLALSVVDSFILKYSDENTWWMYIPDLPTPLKLLK